MLLKYSPEDKAAKERLLNKDKAEAEGKTLETKKPIVVKYGINHMTYLIEQIPARFTLLSWCIISLKVKLSRCFLYVAMLPQVGIYMNHTT